MSRGCQALPAVTEAKYNRDRATHRRNSPAPALLDWGLWSHSCPSTGLNWSSQRQSEEISALPSTLHLQHPTGRDLQRLRHDPAVSALCRNRNLKLCRLVNPRKKGLLVPRAGAEDRAAGLRRSPTPQNPENLCASVISRPRFLTCSWYASVLLWPLVWIKHRPVWGARELCEEGIWMGSGGWNCWMVTLFMLPSYCCSRLRCCRLWDPMRVWMWLPACG